MKPYLKNSLLYLAFGVVWIYASDRVIDLVTQDPAVLRGIQTGKGWFFVGLSALLIFAMGKRAFEEQAALARERSEVFRKTVEGAHHILLNYLNQMELVMLEAASCPEFDQEVYDMARKISDEAAKELVRLGMLSDTTTAAIESFVYRNLSAGRDEIGARKV